MTAMPVLNDVPHIRQPGIADLDRGSMQRVYRAIKFTRPASVLDLSPFAPVLFPQSVLDPVRERALGDVEVEFLFHLLNPEVQTHRVLDFLASGVRTRFGLKKLVELLDHVGFRPGVDADRRVGVDIAHTREYSPTTKTLQVTHS